MTTEVGATAAAASKPQISPTIRRGHRQRRPSGAAPPLPRSIGISGKGWLITVGVLAAWIVVMKQSDRANG